MRILFVSSEVYPFSKTGGLADVAGALPKALAALGHELLVISPWYAGLETAQPLWVGDVSVPFEGGWMPVGVGRWQQQEDGYHLEHAFVGHPFFQREAYYGYADDMRRFALFSRAVPQVAARCGMRPQLVHCNDWQTGYLPLILERGWHMPSGFDGLPSVFSIHNARFQGEAEPAEIVHQLRLESSLQEGWLNFYGTALALRAGIGYADAVTTVSPSYAQEIVSPEYGYNLAGSYQQIQHKLHGILNGIDTEVWRTHDNPALPASYDADDLRGKQVAKRQLCQHYGLDAARPLLITVSRLAEQKGIDIVMQALDGLVAQGWSVFMMGTGDPELEAWIRQQYHRPHMASYVGYQEQFSHLVYAAADAIAIASRFEPCGLTQLISMRYGTLPIARATGGLRDTIRHGETGFLFEDANPEGLLWASDVARRSYDSPQWCGMVRRAMQQDFSWHRSARAYLEVYKDVIPK